MGAGEGRKRVWRGTVDDCCGSRAVMSREAVDFAKASSSSAVFL